MRSQSPSPGERVVLCFALALCAVMALAQEPVAAQTPTTLEAPIFRYDGQDFVRVRTTLRTEDGKPAVNTTLGRETPAYKALFQKRSYSGNVTVFGRKYDAHYAPLTSGDGRLTGALFVAVPR
ncbi:MAG: Cache 3/Cache 2 fusion domain-containing protein [Steroidobacteraceae bacterium]|nr:Cache 3/Cache 2 fusion domain-containing protein [Steroidobacteraceae bacterium]